MKGIVLFLMIGCILWTGCATQNDLDLLSRRMIAIERHNRELSEQNDQLMSRLEEYSKTRQEKDQNLRSQSAELDAKLDGFRAEMQQSAGEVEEKTYALEREISGVQRELQVLQNSLRSSREQQEAAQTLAKENRDRIERVEQYLNFEDGAPSAESPATSVKPEQAETATGALDAETMYTRSKQAFDQGDFEAARSGFQKLIEQFPQSDQADNAQFWIGETYYREKWYEKAILEYQKVIENHPKGNKVPASLLKQGFAFYNLGDMANSRLILKELISKYPKSNEARIAEEKLESVKP